MNGHHFDSWQAKQPPLPIVMARVITQNYKMLIAMNIRNKTNPPNVMDPMFLHRSEWE